MWLDVKAAWQSLAKAKMRTALTMLGIVIGVASITIILALGQGFKAKLDSQIHQFGDNVLTIRSGQSNRNEHGGITNYNFFAALGTSTLTEKDLQIVQSSPDIAAAAPIMAITGTVSATANDEASNQGHILATSAALQQTLELEVRSGQFLDPNISDQTVVLGADIASKLLGSDTAIGKKVYIRNQEFTVIGILKQTELQPTIANIYDMNQAVLINLHGGKLLNHGMADIQQINARAAKGSTEQAAHTLTEQLRANHNGQEDFTVLRPSETLAVTNSLVRLLTGFTTAVAAISLVVGGIGIMNIMLVSVTERTREIGIRKAVGATSSQILKQFVTEALLMCVIGGIIGVVMAYGLAFFASIFIDFTPVITWQILLLALGIATGTGLVFGLAPAFTASRKDPIEALRYVQ